LAIRLNKKDVMQTTEYALTLFRNGIRSKATRATYEKRLKEFLCGTLENYLDGNKIQRERQRKQRLADGNKKILHQSLMLTFLRGQARLSKRQRSENH